MQHWKITNKRIYQLLKHPYQIDKSIVEEMSSAYIEFMEDLFNFLNKTNDNKELIRKLNATHIEFATIKTFEESIPTENSKLKIVFLDKLLSLLNMEQELVYRQMEYPKFFINIESEWKSPFYLNPEVVNSTDAMEVVSGFFHIETQSNVLTIRRCSLVILLMLSASSSMWTSEMSIKKKLRLSGVSPIRKLNFWRG